MDAKTKDRLLAASLRQAAKALSDAAAIIDGNLPGADRTTSIASLLRALDVGEKNGVNLGGRQPSVPRKRHQSPRLRRPGVARADYSKG